MKVLVVNCGSSSLKYQVIDSETEEVLCKGICERIGIDGRLVYTPEGGEKEISDKAMPTHKEAVNFVLEAISNPTTGVIKDLGEIEAVGHRVVHGGEKFTSSVVITEDVIKTVEACNDLAPLHNPANIIGIRACMELMPGVPMVGVFDTAFHQTMPAEAYMYGIPYKYYEQYGVRKYGFHGTSHSFVSKRIAEILGRDVNNMRTIVCHLGGGASICAVENGKSIDTTMGLSPLEGLIMGTRSGDIDPSAIEFIAKKEGFTLEQVLDVLNKKSGVYGLSGDISSDFRDLQDAAANGDKKAELAIDVFCYRAAKFIGGYVAIMGGVDAIVFTAGLGENDYIVRQKVMDRMGFLGVKLDSEANKVRGEEKRISTADSNVEVWVVPTNEELAICRETVALVK